MKRVMAVALVVVLAGVVGTARADDKPNPTGTWKWKSMAGNREVERTLHLKLEGDKLTGAMVGRNNQETPIEDATYKDGEVSFKVTTERNGQKSTTTYTGKVSGDTIKGKSDRMGGQSRDWEAKRSTQ